MALHGLLQFRFGGLMQIIEQCTQAILGAGASGSSTISARLFAPSGAPANISAGETSLPSQVYFAGIAPICTKSVEPIATDTASPPKADEARNRIAGNIVLKPS